MMEAVIRVLGIDPGYDRLGIAIVERVGGKESILYSSCFEPSKSFTFEKRIRAVGNEVERVIKKYKPVTLAIEKTFFNRNRKTAISVSEARGAILYAAARSELNVCEYSPQEVKLAVTGYGKSDKKQVAKMLHSLIEIEKEIKRDDEYDAIAIALTHCVTQQ